MPVDRLKLQELKVIDTIGMEFNLDAEGGVCLMILYAFGSTKNYIISRPQLTIYNSVHLKWLLLTETLFLCEHLELTISSINFPL